MVRPPYSIRVLVLNRSNTLLYYNVWVMPRHAPELECSAEDKASLVAITKSRTEEARAVERARIILACLQGKQIQQIARELGVSIPT